MKKKLQLKKHIQRISNKTNIISQRLAISAFFLIFAISLLFTGDICADNNDGEVENTRAALEKWVETQRIISQEKQDFELACEMLSERIELVKNEIESLKNKIEETEESITEADKKRAELLKENEKLKDTTASLSGTVIDLESRTKKLVKLLPNPISDRIKPLSQRLPENQDETKLSLGERFQNIVGILNEVNKFNREITVTSEVRKLPDEKSSEVTALYIGVGHAYYVNGNGDIAGVGKASSEGWVWTPANESAAEIAKAIAILKNETAAAFVQLPIKINN